MVWPGAVKGRAVACFPDGGLTVHQPVRQTDVLTVRCSKARRFSCSERRSLFEDWFSRHRWTATDSCLPRDELAEHSSA